MIKYQYLNKKPLFKFLKKPIGEEKIIWKKNSNNYLFQNKL